MPFLKNTLPFLACTCLLIVTSAAQADEAGILVTVKDQFGGTVPDAAIVLGKSGEKEKRAATNSVGIAQLSKLPAGKYQIVATFGGKAEKRSVAVGSALRTVDFRWGSE